LVGGDDDALLVAVSVRLLVGQLLLGEATRDVARSVLASVASISTDVAGGQKLPRSRG
jgi:hypothetical protein